MQQTSTSESVCHELAAASALVADLCRPGVSYGAEPVVDLFTRPSTAKSHVVRILGTLHAEKSIRPAVYGARCASV